MKMRAFNSCERCAYSMAQCLSSKKQTKTSMILYITTRAGTETTLQLSQAGFKLSAHNEPCLSLNVTFRSSTPSKELVRKSSSGIAPSSYPSLRQLVAQKSRN